METLHGNSSAHTGLDTDLDLAEMEIASGRFGEARLRFARMTRIQRETPRALLLRARATESEESRRMLASFAREALKVHEDAVSRSQLAEALALCGDRVGALKYLPEEFGLSSAALGARKQALEALGTVPDLPENEDRSLSAIFARRFIPDRKTAR